MIPEFPAENFILNPLNVISKYYSPGSLSYQILTTHSQLVTQKSLALAKQVPHLNPDIDFIAEAAMLHDIGILFTNAPDIGCFGEHHYLAHGYLGRELLDREDLPRHALVCERHTGVGLTIADIQNQGLPLPVREMVPVSLEEKIICFADCFFSKKPAYLLAERSLPEVRASLARFAPAKADIIDEWAAFFGIEGGKRS